MLLDSHMHVGDLPYFTCPSIAMDWWADVAVRDPTVYLEPSGMPKHSKVGEAAERVGSDRVLYGSDHPFHHPPLELTNVRVSRWSSDQDNGVLEENGRQLFFGSLTPPSIVV